MFEKYDAYKDSYIQGIKLIPEKWKVIKLKYLLDSKAGFAFPSDAFSDSGTAVVRISDLLVSGVVDISKSPKLPSKFNKYLSEYFAEEGNILMAMTGGTIGKVSIYKYEQKSFLNQRVCKFIPKANFYPKLAWYWMNTDVWKDYIDLKAFGGAQPNISDNTIKEMQICLPDSLDTQISICNFLDKKTYEIEQVIAIKEQQIALLNERKQIVIQKAVTQGLDPNVPMKDSGVEWVAQIPEKWKLMRLKFLLSEINVRSETGDETLLSLSKYKGVIPKDALDERAGSASTLVGYKKVFKDNLVINKMQAVNGLLAVSELEGITSPDYSVYSAKDNSVSINYITFLLNQPEYLAEMKKRVTGVMEGFIRLYTDDLFDIKVLLPSYAEQLKIVQYINTVIKQVEEATSNLVQQIEKLKEYKTTLINDAVTGKIKVA